MAYYRRLSPLEKLIHIGHPNERLPEHVNAFVIEANQTNPAEQSGSTLIKQDWEQAIQTLRSYHPGAQLKLKGRSMFSYWDDAGHPPKVIELDASTWDGRTLHHANFLQRPLNIRKDHCGELLLLHGHTPRVLLRMHHAAMDGKGNHSYLMDLFRVLRGETPQGVNSRIYDWQLRHQSNQTAKTQQTKSVSPFGPTRNMDNTCQWLRVTIPVPYHQRILVKLCKLLTLFAVEQWGNEQVKEHLNYNIAVDLRRYLSQNQFSTANLTGFVKLHMSGLDDERSIHQRLASSIRNGDAIRWPRHIEPLSWLPSKLFHEDPKIIARRYNSNHFQCSALISPMGKTHLSEMHYEKFRAITNYGVATGNAALPLFIGVCEGGMQTPSSSPTDHPLKREAIELLLSAPNAVGGMERLQQLGCYFRKNLVPSKAANNKSTNNKPTNNKTTTSQAEKQAATV